MIINADGSHVGPRSGKNNMESASASAKTNIRAIHSTECGKRERAFDAKSSFTMHAPGDNSICSKSYTISLNNNVIIEIGQPY